VKHSALLIMVGVFNYAFEPRFAQWASLGMLAAVVIISAVVSKYRSRVRPAGAVSG
jgi:hypothetical protein